MRAVWSFKKNATLDTTYVRFVRLADLYSICSEGLHPAQSRNLLRCNEWQSRAESRRSLRVRTFKSISAKRTFAFCARKLAKPLAGMPGGFNRRAQHFNLLEKMEC